MIFFSQNDAETSHLSKIALHHKGLLIMKTKNEKNWELRNLELKVKGLDL